MIPFASNLLFLKKKKETRVPSQIHERGTAYMQALSSIGKQQIGKNAPHYVILPDNGQTVQNMPTS